MSNIVAELTNLANGLSLCGELRTSNFHFRFQNSFFGLVQRMIFL
jgi:hypothetical protein